MATSTLYRQHTDAVLLSARLAAITAAGQQYADPRIEAMYRSAEEQAAYRLTSGPLSLAEREDRRTVLAAQVATHALAALVEQDDDSALPDAVAAAATAVAAGPDQRLQQARELASLAELVEHPQWPTGALDDLVRLLRKQGAELVAAAGHLVRRACAHPQPWITEHGAGAWYAVAGRYLLVPREITRAAAVGMVASGEGKQTVAGMAGISRTTLDAWLAD